MDQPNFFSIASHTSFYFGLIREKVTQDTGPVILAAQARGMVGLWARAGAWCWGPGWFPGTPRLGDSSAVAEVNITSHPVHGMVMLWVMTHGAGVPAFVRFTKWASKVHKTSLAQDLRRKYVSRGTQGSEQKQIYL